MGIRGARKYTPAQRQEAVEAALELGVAAAARKLGIPKGTVSCWKHFAQHRGNGSGQRVTPGVDPAPKNTRNLSASARAGWTGGQDGGSPEARSSLVGQEDCTPSSPSREQPEPAAASDASSSHAAPERGRAENKLSGRVARVYTPSERARALERAEQIGVSAAAKELGISRFSIQEWRRKLRQHAAGETQTSPVTGPDEPLAQRRDRRILEEWQKHPGLGPSQIRNQLRRAGEKVSVHTVRRVMQQAGYRPPKVKRSQVHDRRYEAVRPNQLWHFDFFHRYVNKQRIFVLLLLDDHSRFITGGSLHDGERADEVIQTFEAAISRHGRPETVMTDGGSAFFSWRGVGRFTRLLEEYGIDQLVARVPQVNGKLEVLNANAQKELFNVQRFFDLAETRRRFDGWVQFYNLRRTHHALGGLLVPADRYYGRAQRVLAAIEAGQLTDTLAQPAALGSRVLDLVRLCSQGGELTLHVMGQKVWPPARSQ